MPLRAHTLLAQWEPRPALQGQLRQKAQKCIWFFQAAAASLSSQGKGTAPLSLLLGTEWCFVTILETMFGGAGSEG